MRRPLHDNVNKSSQFHLSSYGYTTSLKTMFSPVPSKIPIHFVFSFASKIIFAIIVSGIESSIPTIPSNHPQNSNERKIMSVESPNLFP